jgi:hypothetical protein
MSVRRVRDETELKNKYGYRPHVFVSRRISLISVACYCLQK